MVDNSENSESVNRETNIETIRSELIGPKKDENPYKNPRDVYSVGILDSPSEDYTEDKISLVMTGADHNLYSAGIRTTQNVVESLISEAKKNINIVSYVLSSYDEGKPPKTVILNHVMKIIEKCKKEPDLRVQFFSNDIYGQITKHEIKEWDREKCIYHDGVKRIKDNIIYKMLVAKEKEKINNLRIYNHVPIDPGMTLHAKVISVDGSKALITSANLTESGQNRNFECGILVQAERIVSKIDNFFEKLKSEPGLIIEEMTFDEFICDLSSRISFIIVKNENNNWKKTPVKPVFMEDVTPNKKAR